jgi:predicted nucleotidyltransferase
LERSIAIDIEGIKVQIPSLADLIRNKRASGRTKDIADADALEELRHSEEPPGS